MRPAPDVAWRPPADDEITWFQVLRGLPLTPRPLEYTCEVAAFTWGLAQALAEGYWPLYELRARLIDGQLYLGAAPSPHAERDLANRLRLMREVPLRHMQNIASSWEVEGRPEVEAYDARMEAFPPEGSAGAELGEAFFRLKRARADQWCAAVRVVICPTVIVQQGAGETPLDEAMTVAAEARTALQHGGRVFSAALERTGERLMRMDCIDAPDDVAWLEYGEVRAALERGGAYQATVVARRASAAGSPPGGSPPRVGPPLSPDAPPLYLLRDVLELIGVEYAR